MRRIHIERRKVRRGRPWLEVVALDPRDPDVVRAKTGRCGEQQPAVTGNDARRSGRHPASAAPGGTAGQTGAGHAVACADKLEVKDAHRRQGPLLAA
jgi:hypothetical protein